MSAGVTLSGVDVTYSAVGENGIKVSFGSGTVFGGAVSATIDVDADVPNSPFFGNYLARGINAVRFGVTGTGHAPKYAFVYLVGNGKAWRADFDVSTKAGARTEIVLPLTCDAWSTSWPGVKETMLADTLKNVTAVQIYLAPKAVSAAYTAQSYTFDSLVLVNDDGISTLPASLTEAQKAMIARFGYGNDTADKLSDELKAIDEDGDGMVDYVEILSENDEAFANSIFTVEDIEVSDDGVAITWACVNGETYTVVRAASIGGEAPDGTRKATRLVAVDGLQSIAADDTGFMTRTDATASGDGPFYYRILKH